MRLLKILALPMVLAAFIAGCESDSDKWVMVGDNEAVMYATNAPTAATNYPVTYH